MNDTDTSHRLMVILVQPIAIRSTRARPPTATRLSASTSHSSLPLAVSAAGQLLLESRVRCERL